MIRNKELAIALAGICLLSIAASNAFASDRPAVGRWNLDTQHSSYGTLVAPKFEQMIVTTDEPAALKWMLKGMTTDGKSYISSYDGPIDGKYHPIIDSEGGATIAYSRSGTVLTWTMKNKTGAVIESGSGVVSQDGKTLTLKGTAQGPNGKSEFVSVFQRAAQ